MLSPHFAENPNPFLTCHPHVFLRIMLSSLTHHLNIRRHSGEKVKKLVVVDHVRISELLGELIHTCGPEKENHFEVTVHTECKQLLELKLL